MATRAVVKFQWRGETEAIIYKHCDGYPEGLGSLLLRFIEEVRRSVRSNFLDSAGGMAARFCAYLLKLDAGEVVEVMMAPPGDEEYTYVVECRGASYTKPPTVVCYRPDESGKIVEIPTENAK